MKRFISIFLIAFLLQGSIYLYAMQKEKVYVMPVPVSLPIDTFYKKYIDANGIPVVASDQVSDEALIMAYRIVTSMLEKRKDIADYMSSKGCKVMIIGENEETLDLPEYRWLGKTEEDRVFWNKRARGFGGAPEHDFSASCGEENLICLPSDRYVGENILIHEFAHLIHLIGIEGVEPGFNDKLEKLYQKTKAKGLWAKTYAMENKEEYFAESVQSFFDSNRYADPPNGVHNSINRKKKLKAYDPEMYELLLHYFSDNIKIPICNVIHE